MTQKKVYSGKLIKLYESTKILPDGRKGYFEEIKHPGASLVVPFLKDKIVFIRQYRGIIGKYLWELPAGKLSWKEEPSACAKREVAEETGYIVKNIRKIGMIYTTPGFCDEKIHIFSADCSEKRDTNKDWDEFITVKLLTRKEAVKLVRNGKLNDAKTVAALVFAGVL